MLSNYLKRWLNLAYQSCASQTTLLPSNLPCAWCSVYRPAASPTRTPSRPFRTCSYNSGWISVWTSGPSWVSSPRSLCWSTYMEYKLGNKLQALLRFSPNTWVPQTLLSFLRLSNDLFSKISFGATEWFDIFVSLYLSTVVLDSIFWKLAPDGSWVQTKRGADLQNCVHTYLQRINLCVLSPDLERISPL